MKIAMKKDKIIIEEITEKPIVIPSQLYPLNGSLEIFYYDNTEDCADQQIREIFDSVTAAIGYCYTNVQRMVEALETAAIQSERYTAYVGWLFIGDTLPVHHAFIVVDDKYMLDFSTDKLFEDGQHYSGLTQEEVKDRVAKQYIERRKLKNSERAAFGKVGSIYLYIGSRCKPQDGKRIYQRLVKAYPKHPCIRNVTVTGATDTQNRIFREIIKSEQRK